jgi:DNA-binding IclR family transcriptional regulator
MRIDPKDTIGGHPALVVRKTLRHLRDWHQWKLANLEAAAALPPGTGHALLNALRTEGLIEASGTGAWTLT